MLANVYSVKSQQPLFAPYRILDKPITATGADGKPMTATHQGRHHRLYAADHPVVGQALARGEGLHRGLRETAQKFIPAMRAKGADLVVAISHGGLDDSPYSPTMENGNWYLAQVPGIDAMLIGHSHQLFPNAASTAPHLTCLASTRPGARSTACRR